MRRFVSVCLVLVAACGGNLSEEDLAEVAAPLVEAHDALEDFHFKLGAGMTRGDFMDEWPTVASQVARGIDDFYETVPDDVPEADMADLDAYAAGLAETTDDYTEAATATREFINVDTGYPLLVQQAEDDMDAAMTTAASSYARLEGLKAAALTPGE